MKRKLLLLSVIISLLYSCSGGFSKGVKKDLSTGLSASYNGFGLDDIYLAVGDADTRINSNTVELGSKISVMATGVDYFTEKNGKVFPGCSIILTDKSGKEILNLPDAFADMTEGTEKEKARTLRAQLNTGDPMLVGKTYHLKTRFFDKNNKEHEIVAEVNLVMK